MYGVFTLHRPAKSSSMMASQPPAGDHAPHTGRHVDLPAASSAIRSEDHENGQDNRDYDEVAEITLQEQDIQGLVPDQGASGRLKSQSHRPWTACASDVDSPKICCRD